jgi:hypothetical protein
MHIFWVFRWMGICLLGCLVEQCQTELFNEHCLSWLKILVQILQVGMSENRTTMITKLITYIYFVFMIQNH